MKTCLPGVAALALFAASGAFAQTQSTSTADGKPLPPGHPDVAVVSVIEPDRGGKPADGDLWRQSTTVAVDGRPDVIATDQRIANTPIPDSMENRRKFGGPMSHAGKMTPARPGYVG